MNAYEHLVVGSLLKLAEVKRGLGAVSDEDAKAVAAEAARLCAVCGIDKASGDNALRKLVGVEMRVIKGDCDKIDAVKAIRYSGDGYDLRAAKEALDQCRAGSAVVVRQPNLVDAQVLSAALLAAGVRNCLKYE